jgi:type II secretory pathway predicted ATPase ExeA
MYKKFFGLKENPFNVNPDPRYLFLTQHTQEALACLTYGIETRKGFILLTGEVGTGKTTLINKLLEWLHKERVSTAFVFNPRLSVSQFFDFMMADFGIPCESRQKGQMLMKLNQWLLERYQAGERAVLIVDEAQNLSPQMLEEIRLLTNLETSTEKLLQIVLAGQPELDQKLNQPQLRQLRQRITLRAKTRQLTLEETKGYIEERLRIAGAENPDIFSPGAIEAVHRYARGIPRVTNLLCEHSLVSSFVDQKNPVPAEIVEEVARDFELHIVDPTAQAPAQALGQAFTPGTNGDQPPLIESLLQALNTLVDRLNAAEAAVETDRDRKP